MSRKEKKLRNYGRERFRGFSLNFPPSRFASGTRVPRPQPSAVPPRRPRTTPTTSKVKVTAKVKVTRSRRRSARPRRVPGATARISTHLATQSSVSLSRPCACFAFFSRLTKLGCLIQGDGKKRENNLCRRPWVAYMECHMGFQQLNLKVGI